MDYTEFTRHVQELGFIEDDETADASVKAVLGILANRLPEADARQLIDRLPEPLTMEKLRSRQPRPLDLTVQGYFTEVGIQFGLSAHEAHELVDAVLHVTHQCVGDETWQQVCEHLPAEWHRTLEAA